MPITLKLQNPIPAHEKSGGSLKKKSLIVLEITFFWHFGCELGCNYSKLNLAYHCLLQVILL